jgi:hypothetical protein
MDSYDADKLRRAIRRLVRAEIANSWKGGGDPEDIPVIGEELHAAKTRLSVLITQLTKPEDPPPNE